MIITIDGPTASGKSSIARMLARDLSCYYLYSGLLYRAVGYLLVRECAYTLEKLTAPEYADLQTVLASEACTYTYDAQRGAQIFSYGEPITHHLKTPEVDRYAYIVSAYPLVRAEIVRFQRNLAEQHTLIADGRDCGTVVFPHAEHKFFLTAHPEIRAHRWQQDQLRAGKEISLEASLAALTARDGSDTTREHSPLIAAHDAHYIDNSELDLAQTLIVFKDKIDAITYQTELVRELEN